jgi:hypothetical protein
MRIRKLDPVFHFGADPDPTFNDADTEPDPTTHSFTHSPDLDPRMLQNDHLKLPPFHFDADPDRAFHFDADPDPASQNEGTLLVRQRKTFSKGTDKSVCVNLKRICLKIIDRTDLELSVRQTGQKWI